MVFALKPQPAGEAQLCIFCTLGKKGGVIGLNQGKGKEMTVKVKIWTRKRKREREKKRINAQGGA